MYFMIDLDRFQKDLSSIQVGKWCEMCLQHRARALCPFVQLFGHVHFAQSVPSALQ